MNQRHAYLLQILEKIGSPLMVAILLGQDRPVSGDAAQHDAKKMAELLARTTMTSIDLARAMDLSGTEDQGDAVRLAMAALAGNMIGASYRHTGKTPGETDVKKITAAMQAVLTYSENFAPSGESARRLTALGADGQETDAQQTALQYIHAFIPVVNAISIFPFGQPEQKLIMDVSSRLIAKASEMSAVLLGSGNKAGELAILRMLGQVYGACHEAETARLMGQSEEKRALGSLESVWQAFDLRVSMLEALAKSLIPITSSSGAANPLSMFAKKPAEDAEKPQNPPASAPPAAAPPPVSPPASSSGGPMSFFKSPPKKSDE